MDMSFEEIEKALAAYADPEKRVVLPRFFKTGKGEYGEGDRFLGVVVPNTRRVARQCKDAPFAVVEQLLGSPWHECRLCGLLILVERFKKADERCRKVVYDLYCSNTQWINNWDLVDLSVPYIVGEYLLDKPRTQLYVWAQSHSLWERRMAIVATHAFVRRSDFTDACALSERLLLSQHDLMQKAVGWTLREVGKRDKEVLTAFLDRHAAIMPRTMLRYSIEHFPAPERKYYMDQRKKAKSEENGRRI